MQQRRYVGKGNPGNIFIPRETWGWEEPRLVRGEKRRGGKGIKGKGLENVLGETEAHVFIPVVVVGTKPIRCKRGEVMVSRRVRTNITLLNRMRFQVEGLRSDTTYKLAHFLMEDIISMVIKRGFRKGYDYKECAIIFSN